MGKVLDFDGNAEWNIGVPRRKPVHEFGNYNRVLSFGLSPDRDALRGSPFGGEPCAVFEHVETPFGRSAFVCIPRFADELDRSDRLRLLTETQSAIDLACQMRARAVSLACKTLKRSLMLPVPEAVKKQIAAAVPEFGLASCQLEGVLLARLPDLPPTIGRVDIANARAMAKAMPTGIEASPCHVGTFKVQATCMEACRVATNISS